jgi:exopolysaccharide production protein ExoZ
MPTIQVLRAFAAYLVVFVHLAPLVIMAGGAEDSFNWGYAGVDLFFVISGFIMVYTTSRRETQPWDFFAHRIARVVPLYWLLTLVVFAGALFLPSLFQATQANVAQLIKSLFFVPFQKDNGLVQPIVFVGWTLNYEMFFYAIFAFCLFIKPRLVSLSLLFAILTLLVLFKILWQPTALEVKFFTDPFLLEFAMGAALCLALVYLPLKNTSRWPLVILGAIAASSFVWMTRLSPDISHVLSMGVPASILVFVAVMLDRTRIRWPDALILLGDASYSIYLTHFFVTQIVVIFARRLHLQNMVALGLFLLIAMVVVGFVGVLVHILIEKPLNSRVRAWIGLTPSKRPVGLSVAN